MGNTQIVDENAVKYKKTVLNPSHVPNSTKIYVKSYKQIFTARTRYISVSQTMGRDPNMGRQGFLSGSRKASVDTVNLLA